jgi:Asp-tRNA(Asn)/Glu-tRNA(Gln) amidotransferase C subunit
LFNLDQLIKKCAFEYDVCYEKLASDFKGIIEMIDNLPEPCDKIFILKKFSTLEADEVKREADVEAVLLNAPESERNLFRINAK